MQPSLFQPNQTDIELYQQTVAKIPDDQPELKPRSRSRSNQDESRPVIHYPSAHLDQGPPPKFIAICWPLVAGVILAFMAPTLQTDLLAAPRWAMWIVFPFVELTGRRDFGIPPLVTDTLPTLILFIQFPIEGLLAFMSLSRRAPILVALAPTFFLHVGGFFVLLLVNSYMK
jgi:hypothetical protein